MIVLDTNILIYLISGRLKHASLPKGVTLVCPSIVMIEALGYRSITVQEEREIRKMITDDCIIAHLNNEIVEQAIGIRQTAKVKSPDAIVAATALTLNSELWTANVKDFQHIEKLKLRNPIEGQA